MDEDNNQDLNASISHLLPSDDSKLKNSKYKKTAAFSKGSHLYQNREVNTRQVQSKSITDGSVRDGLLARRHPQNSQFSLHLKEILQDTSTFSRHNLEIPDNENEYDFKSTEDNGAVPKERVTCRCMSLDDLQNLIEKSSDEIVHIILDKESEFIMVFEENFNRDCTAYVLLALKKAVSSDNNKNVASMLNLISSKINTFLFNIQQYLASFQIQEADAFHMNAVVNLIRFLLKFHMCLPSNACDVLIMILPLLKETCERYLSTDKEMYSESTKLLQQLEELNSSLISKYTLKQIKETSRNEKLQLLDPPEDYRSIPILANEVDIQQPCAFLRPSVIKGHYQNTEHYLDVQYRLLREDYVRPLRDGITQYLALKDRNQSLKLIKDIKVYPYVQILKQEFVNGELLHMAYIHDKKFSKIKWEFSKRLLSKSLLCLSSDNFKNMLFATVARRDPKELVKGLLLLRFEELTDEVLSIDQSRNFVVIETTAYFEAYRYNLDALLELKDENLPMKRYIVDTQKNVLNPQYLDQNVTYDMRPILLPLSETSRKQGIDENGQICYDYIYPNNISEHLKNVTILNDNSWPICLDLNLDVSQYAALKAAITKEFTIVQGPPGTGKTYVGLRIAQLLLHNADKWQCKTEPSPLLVVCYTNHALDQFLEGILTFTDKVVRIGGRSTNESLSRFQISNLKSEMKRNQSLPYDIFCGIRQQSEQLNWLKKSVNDIKELIERSYTTIFSEKVLKSFMTSAQYYSIISKTPSHNNVLTYEWLLGIKVQESKNERWSALLYSHSFPDEDDELSFKDNGDSEGEADIEYIESQREINPDEFAGASYDIPLYRDKFDSIIGDDWQFVRGKQGLKDKIYTCLSSTKPMNVKIAKKIKDVWSLSSNLKWSLYKFWLEGYIRKKNERITELHQKIREEYNQLQEMRTQEDICICEQALVIGMTTTGAAKYRKIVQKLNPRIVIVEEAAEILESHIITSLTRGTQHLILIGDHQQLRPSPTVHLLATKYHMNISLFERMIENGIECYKLEIQHRMRPEIASLLVPHIYPKLYNHESVNTFENIKGVDKNVFFVNHSYYELQENDSKSKVNVHEANFLLKFCKYLVMQGYKPSEITVLTTYSGQLFQFKRNDLKVALQGVRFCVVDNYQGEENNIILISFVRSNEEGQIGFLKISNRVCVALSRAKKGLYCIGNFGLLAEKSNLWKNIVGTLESSKAIGSSLLLTCQNHPNKSKAVTYESDFDFVPEGGCTQQCEFRLLCGHLCSLKCHPYDPKHEDIQCPKPCIKQCSEGHICKMKCFEQCPPCSVLLSKTIEICGHTIQVPCHLFKKITPCTEPCEKLLPCGHKCVKKCGDSCTLECFVKVLIKSSVCNHEVSIECAKSKDEEILMLRCKEPCSIELPCRHTCSGSCGSCYQGRLHVACKEPCNRRLVCGHDCKSICCRICPPCEQTCENYCKHRKCTRKCGEPCEKCREPCQWICSHKKCTRLCSELCDRTVCNEPCPKVLKCNHPCIGICGELCPVECKICDREEIEKMCLGRKVESDAMFLRLEECQHIFELNWFTQWMSQENREKSEIQYKECPTCKTVIRRPFHIEKFVESWFRNIEKIKKAVSGNVDYNDNFKKILNRRIRMESTSSHYLLYSSSLRNSSLNKLTDALRLEKKKDIQDLCTIENVINIMKMWPSRKRKYNLFRSKVSLDSKFFCSQDIDVYVDRAEKWLHSFITRRILIASEQQLKDLMWEVHRLKLINQLLEIIAQLSLLTLDGDQTMHMKKLKDLLLTQSPFREFELMQFISELQTLEKCVRISPIDISELQKQPNLIIMSFSEGHWFVCENKHVYSMVKCRDTAEESKCYECDRNIIDIPPVIPKVNLPPTRRGPTNQRKGNARGRKPYKSFPFKTTNFNTFKRLPPLD